MGDYIGQGQTFTITGAEAGFSAQLIGSPEGMFVRLNIDNAAAGVFWHLDLAAPPLPCLSLTPGAYEEAARASFRGASPGVDFGGDGAAAMRPADVSPCPKSRSSPGR